MKLSPEFKHGSKPEIASVVDFNQETASLTLYTESGRTIQNPIFLSPYYSQLNLNGFFFVPSLGDTYLINYTDKNIPYIEGCITPWGNQTPLANALTTISVNPGDYGFLISPSTTGMANGGLIFRNNGSILIQANSMTSINLIPSINTMLAYLHTIDLTTVAGKISVEQDEFGAGIIANFTDVIDATTVGNMYQVTFNNPAQLPLMSTTLSRMGVYEQKIGFAQQVDIKVDPASTASVETSIPVKIKSPIISVNAPTVLGSDNSADPAVLGNELVSVLNNLIAAVQNLANVVLSLGYYPTGATNPVPVFNSTNATSVISQLQSISSQLQSILSTKVTLV